MARTVNPNLPRWIEEYAAGDSLVVIGKRHGVAPSTVMRALKKAGVTMRRVGKPLGSKHKGGKHKNSGWHALAIAARERGETYAAIAKQWGVSPQSARHVITRSAAA